MNTFSQSIDLLQPEIIANPYPLYARLRSEAPVLWSEEQQQWLVTRYEDVLNILQDASRFSSVPNAPLGRSNLYREAGSIMSGAMLTLDPPQHTRLKDMAEQAFTPARVESIRGNVQQRVEHLLDKVQATGSMDVMRDLASPLPFAVATEFVGVPLKNDVRSQQWATDFFLIFTGTSTTAEQDQQLLKGFQEMKAYFRDLIEERRRNPKDDFLSAFASLEADGAKLDIKELVPNAIMAFSGGLAPIAFLIGNGIRTLLQHPQVWSDLQNDPTLISRTIEEILRYEGPVQWAIRRATADTEIGEQTIEAGAVVRVGLGAANRDPQQFSLPDHFDVRRSPNNHLTFGESRHRCLGRMLARMVGQVAINAVLRRFPQLHLKTDPIEWDGAPNLRGPKSLPVVFA